MSDEIPWTEGFRPSQPDPEMVCAEGETLQLIDVLLGKMSPVLRQSFTMTYCDEMTSREACTLLGVSVGNFQVTRISGPATPHGSSAALSRGPHPQGGAISNLFRQSRFSGPFRRSAEISFLEMAFFMSQSTSTSLLCSGRQMSLTTGDSIGMEKPEWLMQMETVLGCSTRVSSLPTTEGGYYCQLPVFRNDRYSWADLIGFDPSCFYSPGNGFSACSRLTLSSEPATTDMLLCCRERAAVVCPSLSVPEAREFREQFWNRNIHGHLPSGVSELACERSSSSARTLNREMSVNVTIPKLLPEFSSLRELTMTGRRPPPFRGSTKAYRLWPASEDNVNLPASENPFPGRNRSKKGQNQSGLARNTGHF